MQTLGTLASLLLAASVFVSGEDDVSTHDFAACATAEDPPICLLQQIQRSPYAQPLSGHPAFAGAPEIVQLVESRTFPLRESENDQRFRIIQQEPIRLRDEALARVRELVLQGASATDALAPIRETARGREALNLVNGQIHIDSGAEIRAAAYRQVYLELTTANEIPLGSPRALALAAVQAWEDELHEGDEVSTYHNPELGWGGIIAAYASLKNEDGLRRAISLDKNGPLDLADEIRLLFMLDRGGDANLAVAEFIPRTPGQVDEHRRAEQLVVGHAMLSPDAEIRTIAVDFFLHNCTEVDPPPVDPLTSMAGSLSREEIEALATCFMERASAFTRSGAQFARLAFDLWESLGEAERADALMEIWRAYAIEESELRACPGERSLCAKPFYQYALGRRDRVVEGFQFPGFTAVQALSLDLENGRGLIHLETYEDATRQASDIDLALSFCVESYTNPASSNLRVATDCARALIERSGHRSPTEHEWRIMRVIPTMTPRGDAGPYRVAESALRLGWAAAKAGDTELTSEMLETALDIWTRLPEAQPPITANGYLTEIAIAQLRQEGSLARLIE